MWDLQSIFILSISLFITPLWNRRSHCRFTDEGTKAERWSTSATVTRSWRKPDFLHFPTQPPELGCRVPQGVSSSSWSLREWAQERDPQERWELGSFFLEEGNYYCVEILVQFIILSHCKFWAQRALWDKVSSLILKWPTGSSTGGRVGPGRRRLTPPLLLSRWGVLTTTLRGNEGW